MKQAQEYPCQSNTELIETGPRLTGKTLSIAHTLALAAIEQQFLHGQRIESPRDAKDFVVLHFAQYAREVFGCVFLDQRHAVLAYEDLFFGTIDGAAVHPRIVVQGALALNAAALIAVHNHPSGIAEPSNADYSITNRLKESLALIDVRLIDHLIVGGTQVVSLAERGFL